MRNIDVADELFFTSHGHFRQTVIYSNLILAIVVAINLQFETDMYRITTEHTVISDLGIICWGITAAMCLFTAVLLKQTAPRLIYQFLILSSCLSLYLFLDDFLQFHEVLSRNMNFSEKHYYMVLAAVVAVYLFKAWPILMKTNVSVFLFSGLCLALSVIGDGILNGEEVLMIMGAIMLIIFIYLAAAKKPLLIEYLPVFGVALIMSAGLAYIYPHVQHPEYIVEEGLKWLGIASWCSYFMHTSFHFIRGAFAGNQTAI